MTDRLVRGLFPDEDIRFAVCDAAGLCGDAARRHRADWMATYLLSEALTCACLLSVQLKGEEKFTLRWIYPGPVGTILADTTAKAHVRGFPQRLRIMGEAATVGEAIGGDGRISATTSTPGKVLQTGITEGIFRDVSRDMSHLFSMSIQVETAMAVGLRLPPEDPPTVQAATGVLLQPLPGADLERFEQFRAATEDPAFRDWLEASPRDIETVIETIAPAGGRVEILEEIEPRFQCACSKGKVESVLRMFEPEELKDMIEKEGGADVNCHFCATSYSFNRAEIQTLIGQSRSGHA